MPATIRRTSIYAITTRKLQVLRTADVTPGMRRVTIGGPELAAHVAENGFPVNAFRSDGFDDEFKLILPDAETGELQVPTQHDGRLTWPRGSFGATRTYTVRRWDPVAGEIDVDVVRHGSGPATTWAYSCRPGDDIHVAGPKMSGAHPETGWLLIGGDETAIPAIARWLEEMPAGTVAHVYIEVASADHAQELRTSADATITWLDRRGAPAGTTTLLEDALRAAPWPSDDVYAWVAGEALTLAPIRRWLRNEKGLPKDRVEVTGYWRRSGDADGVTEVEAPEEDPDETLHELLEVVPGIAVRVGVTLGLFAALARQPHGAGALAHELGLDEGATLRLLRYLAALELVEETDDRFTLTAVGQELDDDHYVESLTLAGVQGARTLGAVGLLDAVRTGRAGYPRTFGRTFETVLAASPELAASELRTDYAEWTGDPLSRTAAIRRLTDLRISGPGSITTADELLGRMPGLRVRLLVTPSQADAARDHAWQDPARVTVEVGGLLDPRPERSEGFLLVDALTTLPDADAAHALRQASASTRDGAVLVLDEPLDLDDADEHDLEADLVALAVHGGARRTAAQTDALAAAAGLRLVSRETVGWGSTLRRYVPQA